jgi:tetratricopeptide (TPR) repeat protein
MALGQALTLLSALALQSFECEPRAVDSREIAPFLRVVNLYGRGQSEEAFRELGTLDLEVVERMIRQGAPGIDDRCIEAASLLETELAMTLAERSHWTEADAHFEAGWQLSELIEEPMGRMRFQRDWLLAVGLFDQQLLFVNVEDQSFGRARQFLEDAVRLYPTDAEVLLAAGALLEWAGSLRGGDRSHLKEAEELYARARRLAPSETEILLRHGWVLEELGRNDEAEALLRRILELGATEDVLYRSRMALGRIAEAAGRLQEAVAQYETASSTIPSWQVAHIALGHALHTSGSHDRARTVLARALTMERQSADETFGGWWSYELGLTPRLEPLLERMRAEVRR